MQEKLREKNITSLRFCLLIGEKNYETPMTYMNLAAVAITRPLKKIKIAKKGPKPNFFNVYLGTMARLFTKKNLT